MKNIGIIRKITIILALIISLISCKNKNSEEEIKTIYENYALKENDSIFVEKINILDIKMVDKNYGKNIKINNLNYSIELSELIIEKDNENIILLKRNIDNRNRLIKLDNKNKDKYLLEIEYDKQRLKKAENNIIKEQTKITLKSQEIVLIKAELNQNLEKDCKLISYIFIGEINSEKKVDSLLLFQQPGYQPKFIKNDLFTNYKN